MRRAIVAGLLGTLALMLGGCDGKRPSTEAAQTQPPPKPPNCPDSPELDNITLSNGVVVDVRIITNGEITFYVPRDWYHEDSARPSIRADSIRPHVEPYVDYVECPGVVHRWITNVPGGDYGFSFGTPAIDRIRHRAPPNFSLESTIDEVTFGRPWKPDPRFPAKVKQFDPNVDQIPEWNRTGILEPEAHVVVVPGKLFARYRWFRDKPLQSAEWVAARNSVKELTTWLMTPPKERDNNRVFKLGGVE